VGRTAPTASGFTGRELDRRDVLGCPDGVSLFLDDLGVSETGGVDFGAASESGSLDLFVCEELGLSSRSAAFAPAFRICSSVGSADVDFLLCDFGLDCSGVGDSDEASLGGGGVCLGACGFASRATITSCACVWTTRMNPQSKVTNNPVRICRRDKQLRPVRNPPFTKRSDFSPLTA
jgi:hypothetical protein